MGSMQFFLYKQQYLELLKLAGDFKILAVLRKF